MHRDQAIQDQDLARLPRRSNPVVGTHLILLLLGISWFHPLLHKPPLSLPLVTSLNPSQGIVVSEVGLGRTNPIPLGNEG